MVTLAKIFREARRYRAAIRHYGGGWFGPGSVTASLPLFLELYGREKFSPDEIFGLGLLDPALDAAARRRFVSNEKMLHLQLRVNGGRLSTLVDDKLEFQRIADAHGVRMPRLLATFDPRGTAVGGAPVLADPAAWSAFWASAPRDEVIVKPAHGTHGDGVFLVQNRGRDLLVNRKHAFEPAVFLREILALGYQCWLIQQAITSHQKIVALTDSRALQTLRLVTILDEDGTARIVAARFRINGGDQIFDNFAAGSTGNLIATLDPESGAIRHVKGGDPSGFGLRSVTHHPRTGRPFASFRLPLWDEAVALARQAAEAFDPIVTMGWDLGLTDDGVYVIEGNPSWDPLPGEPALHIYEDLARRAARAAAPREPSPPPSPSSQLAT